MKKAMNRSCDPSGINDNHEKKKKKKKRKRHNAPVIQLLSTPSINIAHLQDECGGCCGEQSTSATDDLGGASGELRWA
jgi:hypothetical protein